MSQSRIELKTNDTMPLSKNDSEEARLDAFVATIKNVLKQHAVSKPKLELVESVAAMIEADGFSIEVEDTLYETISEILQLNTNVSSSSGRRSSTEDADEQSDDDEYVSNVISDLKRACTTQGLIKQDTQAMCKEESSPYFGEWIKLTYSQDARVRRSALRELCPCHIQHDVKVFWDRILDMVNDSDANVRYQVLHNLCDGSPEGREQDIIRALEQMHNDPDKKIRRQCHRVLSNYRRTGKWNIL